MYIYSLLFLFILSSFFFINFTKIEINIFLVINNLVPFSNFKNHKKKKIVNIVILFIFFLLSIIIDFISFFCNYIINIVIVIIYYYSIFIYYPFSFFKVFISLSLRKITFFLIRFLIFVETLSLFRKPFTLFVRLRTNLITGHLILELISQIGFPFRVIINFIMIIIETVVRIIQGLVFCLLIILYRNI